MRSPKRTIMRCRSRFDGRADLLVEIATEQTVFEALRAAGRPIASSCTGESVCARCLVKVWDGGDLLSEAEGEERRALDRVSAASDERLACRIAPTGAGLVIGTTYW